MLFVQATTMIAFVWSNYLLWVSQADLVGMRYTNKPKSTADYAAFRNLVLTSIIADEEIHIGPKLERAEQMVTHEILQSDAFNEANISLEIHADDNIQPLMSWWEAKTKN